MDQPTFDTTKIFSVHVAYCGGWGYGKYFNLAKASINGAYPNATVEGTAIPGNTGSLEVTVKHNGDHLVFSKLGGAGYLTEDKIPQLLQDVKAVVEA